MASAGRTSILRKSPALASQRISPPWRPRSRRIFAPPLSTPRPRFGLIRTTCCLRVSPLAASARSWSAGERLPGVKALVNYAGGMGGFTRLDQQPCNPQENVELQLVNAARRGAIPSIWFYAENDSLWGAKLPRAWHAAYVEAGGTAEFNMLPPLPRDGHYVIGAGSPYWRPRLDRSEERRVGQGERRRWSR